jgi:MoxR-like ATPase
VEQRLHPPVSPKSFLRKNDLAERTPEPALGDAPFLRKNDLAERTPEPALGGAPFLRKNDDAHGSDIPERDIARIRSVVQRWKQLPTPSPEARQQMLTALDGLLGDLEDVMRHLQAQDTGRDPDRNRT